MLIRKQKNSTIPLVDHFPAFYPPFVYVLPQKNEKKHASQIYKQNDTNPVKSKQVIETGETCSEICKKIPILRQFSSFSLRSIGRYTSIRYFEWLIVISYSSSKYLRSLIFVTFTSPINRSALVQNWQIPKILEICVYWKIK